MQLDRIPTSARSMARSQSNQHVWVLPAISRDDMLSSLKFSFFPPFPVQRRFSGMLR